LVGIGTRPPHSYERAIEAAARLYGDRSIGEVILEKMAVEARYTVQAIQRQLGNWEGLLIAVFDRYNPLPRVEAVLTTPTSTMEDMARQT
jgi:hypothetical protein